VSREVRVRRSFWGGLVFWALPAPTRAYAFMAVGMLPALLVRAALGSAVRKAVAAAVAQMRVDTHELGAESFRREKRLRIPFVRD
jgi:hypothetical protein